MQGVGFSAAGRVYVGGIRAGDRMVAVSLGEYARRWSRAYAQWAQTVSTEIEKSFIFSTVRLQSVFGMLFG